MGIRSWVSRLFSRRTQSSRTVVVRGKYDAAQTTVENENHWTNADNLSSAAANSPAVRSTLRSRSRYECANNGHAKGLVRTLRNDTVGTGPRCQVTFPEKYFDLDFQREIAVPASAARVVERRFKRWMDAANIADDLRVLVESGVRDGEAFALLFTNPGIADEVKLDLQLMEGDQCTTPDLIWNDPLAIDGIRFDEWGNPAEYHFLRQHPGDPYWVNPWDYIRVNARWVIHWFDPDRPNQKRGIPHLTPALGLYGQMRRYTLATLSAAELAANLAGVLESDQPPDPTSEDAPTIETMDQIPVSRGALLTMPAGWKANQFKPEQPITSYPQFKSEVLTEAGRSVNAPRNISTGSSAEYNYSSGRLDHLPYQRGIRIDRDRIRLVILSRVFEAWYDEAIRLPGYLPQGLPPLHEWDVSWFWDGFQSIDPAKDAQAIETQLRTGQTTLFDVNAEDGYDGEEMLRRKAKQIKLARQIETEQGLLPGTLYPLTPAEQAQPMGGASVQEVPA